MDNNNSAVGSYSDEVNNNITIQKRKNFKRNTHKDNPIIETRTAVQNKRGLVGILDDNINKIVLKLQQLAKVSREPNQQNVVNEILTLFSTLKTDVKDIIKTFETSNEKNNEKITIKKDKDNKYTVQATDYISDTDKGKKILAKDMNKIDVANTESYGNDIKITETQHLVKVQNYINNCHELEYYYANKHKELMTTFAFTLNLYDNFEYAIKIILFLLKNLGPYLEPTDGSDTETTITHTDIYGNKCPKLSIKLPPPLLTGLQTIMKTGKDTQTVLKNMQKTLDDSNIKNIMSKTEPNPPNTPVASDINNDLP